MIAILICYVNWAFPQAYPPTLKIPVTFYDFHSDGSCPDFNPGTVGTNYTAGLRTGMVQDTLDISGFPLRTLDSVKVNLNAGIDKWFRPWQSGNWSFPIYNQPAGTLNHVETVTYDTAFKNVAITDTLAFNYVPGSPGIYSFQSGAFWPLDGKGFGSEPTKLSDGTTILSHNFSFSMRMHRIIQYVPGMTLTFGGNDDIWVYVNHKLALDFGGIHLPVVDSVTLDSTNAAKFGLVKGGHYNLDVFYVERQADASSIILTTQIVAACPCGMVLAIRPHNDTTIAFGDSLRVEALIYDDTGGIHHEYDTLLLWTLFHNGNRGRLETQLGSANVFYSDSGTGLYRIAVTCSDISKFPASSPLLNRSDTANVTVAGFLDVVKRLLTRSLAQSPGNAVEFYNLRGQKLLLYGITHADGIVLERVMKPDGQSEREEKCRFESMKFFG